jgi:hypothetical protein
LFILIQGAAGMASILIVEAALSTLYKQDQLLLLTVISVFSISFESSYLKKKILLWKT